LVVDDLLATGGTAAATAQLVSLAGGQLVGFAFVIELKSLGGRTVLPQGQPVASLLAYD
jgi:adenine phosphoribosyltransferase